MRPHLMVIAGLTILALLLLTALLAPVIAPYAPNEQHLLQGLKGPNPSHLLGQDRLGRDILSRILYGARISLWVGMVTVAVSAMVGTGVGAVAGYWGGWVDELVMRLTDIFLAFPGILLAIAMVAIMGPSLNNVIIALCIMGWVGYARLVRAQVLALRAYDFVQAAEALGANPSRIVIRHILPNVVGPLTVEVTFGMAGAMMAEAGLSFLGLGTQPPDPSWGTMLNEGRQFLLVAPHLTLFPGLALMVVVLGINFLGDGIRDLLDPKRRIAD